MDINNNLEVGDAAPTILEHFVGQKKIVQRLKIALESSWVDGVRLPNMLYTGAPGLGKTALASIMAKEMGAELKEALAQNFCCSTQLHGFLLDSSDKDVLLVDEIHELPSEMQTLLYRAMENGLVFVNSTQSRKPFPVKLPKITIIGATTDEFRLLQPLRDRFKLVLPFEFYSEDELIILMKNRCKQLGWQVEEPVFSIIAQRGRGTPRIALRLLSSIRLTARADNCDILTAEHARCTCELEGIDAKGLGSDERKYLKILAEDNRPIRLNVLACRLGLHQRTVQQIIEIQLIRSGLISKEINGGRLLTPAGMEYVSTFTGSSL